MEKRNSFFRYLGPGFVVAATGVGAGDLIAASVAGARYGVIILWAALLGGLLKFVLNEGIARWQLATETTLLEGWVRKLPRAVSLYFFIYLLLWSFVVAGALISFCGLAAHTLFPLFPEARPSVAAWGAIHSLIAAALVLRGRYQAIENLMKFFIGLMFCVVVASAAQVGADWGEAALSLFLPRVPAQGEGVLLVLGIIGGVGGSVTLLCYSYWLQEKKWRGTAFLRHTRIDLGAAYLLTSLFGAAIIIIAAGVQPGQVEGYNMILSIAGRLAEGSGEFGRWAFMIGFWGAVFSSMLGVWDGVPYLFADFVETYRNHRGKTPGKAAVGPRSTPYRLFLAFLAIPPLLLAVFGRPAWVGILYAVTGAFFMPFLAALLLYMNNQKKWLKELRNGWLANALLAATLLLFLVLALTELG
ncbi:MAG: Nramp family divalent metal transporter [Lewinellaceae bacterium]|nr:Nramp family divalent metal transporter [Lewinellaceae bacterium]